MAVAATPIDILLVEDNPADVRLTREALKESRVRLQVARDGVEAMALLRAAPAAQRPDLILLDLNLPRMDGRAVLARIKQDAAFKTIPTLIPALTG